MTNQLPCPKCQQRQGYKQQRGHTNFFTCLACGYETRMKHYTDQLSSTNTDTKLQDKTTPPADKLKNIPSIH